MAKTIWMKMFWITMFLASFNVNAQEYNAFIDTGTLRGWVTDDKLSGIAYITGVHDAYVGVLVCTPEMKVRDLVSIVKIKLLNSKYDDSFPASTTLYDILTKEFPCPKKKANML
jgi:hypothetical protein